MRSAAGDAADGAVAPPRLAAGEALALLALGLAGSALLARWGPARAEDALGLAPALAALVWIAPFWALALRRGVDPLALAGGLARPRGLGGAAALSGALLGGYVLVVAAVARSRGLAAGPVPWAALAAGLGGGLVFVALPEEWFFRGVLQPALDGATASGRRALGAPWTRGLVLAALLFGVAHVAHDLLAGLGLRPGRALTALPGLWFGWLRARTGSVWPAVVAHALANAVEEGAHAVWAVPPTGG